MKDLKVSREIEDRLPTCIEAEEFYRTLLAMHTCSKAPPEFPNVRRQIDPEPFSSAGVCHAQF